MNARSFSFDSNQKNLNIMDGNLTSGDGNSIKTSIPPSNKGQLIPLRKVIPQVEKLRTESLPMSPLSLNGSLTTVDVCDTSFGKEVIEDMKTTNCGIPDASFSEEVLQDMDYSLDLLREAVPVMCLKKADDSCDDTDIFEEMSAYQVMGIFNNKDSQRRDKIQNNKNAKENELKNKRSYPDKNINILYQNREKEDGPIISDKLECTKLPGKKIEDEDERNNVIQENKKDVINNEDESPMEATEMSSNEYDGIKNKDNLKWSESYSCNHNNYQSNETCKENFQKRESLGDDEKCNKNLRDIQNHINVKCKDMIENSSKVICKDRINVKEISKECKKYENYEEHKEKLLKKNENKLSNLHKNITSQKENALNDQEVKSTENLDSTLQGALHDTSEFTNLNDNMRQIVADFIKKLPSSSENFLVKVEPITDCPMCYFQFNFKHFIFSTITGAYVINCECGLTIYILFEESLHILKDYHSASVSSDACSSFTNVTSLDSEFETSSPVIVEYEKKDFNDSSDRQLSKRKNRTRFLLFNDSDDESPEYDDSDDSYVP